MNVTVGECAFPNMEGAVGFELGICFWLFGPLLGLVEIVEIAHEHLKFLKIHLTKINYHSPFERELTTIQCRSHHCR